MSYITIHDRRFIRTNRGIIATVLSSDSSLCHEEVTAAGSKISVPVKNWEVYNQELIERQESEILEWANETFANSAEKEMFKWRSHWTYGRDMEKWFRCGCRAAKTLEAYIFRNEGLALNCKVLVWSNPNKASVTYLAQTCTTTDELENWIDAARERIAEEKGRNSDGVCFMSMSFNKARPLTASAENHGTVVVKQGQMYLCNFVTNTRLEFSKDISDAIIFPNSESAISSVGRLIWSANLRCVNAKRQENSKSYALKASGGPFAGRYLMLQTGSFIKWTTNAANAKRFSGNYSAAKYVTKLRKLGYTKEKTGALLLCNLRDNTQTVIQE